MKVSALLAAIGGCVVTAGQLLKIVLGICFVLAQAVLAQVQAQAPRSPTPAPMNGALRAETVAKGLEHPWALAFLPDRWLLITERPGRLRLVDQDGRVSDPLSGVPKVFSSGQGGLLDVAIGPSFARDRLIYISYAEPGEGGAGTAVARAQLGNNALEKLEVIWRQEPKVSGPNHFGSRLVFRPDGTLFVTLGDRFSYRDRVQDLAGNIGKVVRINQDGTAPRDNPFVSRAGTRPETWSYGHRNVQAAALHPQTGDLWTVEHGARGGDELNRVEPGKNYGWPVITYGVDYSGAKIGEGTAKTGMEQPVYYWDPVIAPSGMAFYSGDVFQDWRGNILIGSLTPGALVRLVLKDNTVAREERYLGDLRERIRDVQQGPDGLIYLVTDSRNGRVLRISPAAKQ